VRFVEHHYDLENTKVRPVSGTLKSAASALFPTLGELDYSFPAISAENQLGGVQIQAPFYLDD
jgi:hypothetical protein